MRKETFSCYTNIEKKEETFLLDPNVEDEKETFLCHSNIEEKDETFVRNTMHEELKESPLYHPNVTLEDRGDIVPFSGSDSKVVCPQEYFAGIDYRGSLVNADHFLFGAFLNFSAVDCVVRAGTTKLFPSGLFADSAMEADAAEPLSSGPFVDSPDAKSQMAIHIRNGVSIRAAYKAMRKRVRVEARRQRELEEGRPPEVLLESFLEMLKHKLRLPPELPKRVLTSAAKVAKHRRAKDKRMRETPCWWIANGKECFRGEKCAFKHLVPQVQGQTVSKTGVSSPSLATDRDGNRTKVPLPRPVAESVSRSSVPWNSNDEDTCGTDSVADLWGSGVADEQGTDFATDLWNSGVTAVSALCSSEEQELKEDLGRDYWIKVWDDCSSDDDSLLDGWSDDSPCDSGTGAQHEFYTDTGWRSDHWKHDSWRSSYWRTTDCHRKDESYHGCDGTWSKHHVYNGWNSSHWKTTGWDQENERRHNHVQSQWFTHTFFEALSVDQLINSLHRGGGDTTTFTGLEVDPGESLADTAAQSGIIDLRPFRKAEEALFHKFGLKLRAINGNNQAVGIGGKAKVLGKVEMPSGMGGVNGIVKYTVVDSPGVPPLTPVSLL